MRKKIKFLTTVVVLILFSACYKNPIERNTIVFKDSIADVQDALISIRGLLSIMPENPTGLNTNYYFREESLFINASRLGNPDSILLDTVKVFSNFNSLQKNSFVKLSKYLRRNYITSVYLDKVVNMWFFEYRVLPNGDFHDSRNIAILRGKDPVLIQPWYKVLDHKGKIFLLAPIDAKIR